MKNIFLFALASILLTSCAATFNGYTTNGTIVNLEENNFEVVKQVTGSATATYVLGFGGNKKDGLVSEARTKMLKRADMIGKAKAVANEVIDVKTQYILGIIVKYSVTTTADIVEFK